MHRTLHLLTRRDPDNSTEVLAWHEDRALLEAEALRLEWKAYEQAMALAGCSSIPVLSPDHTPHRSHTVVTVPRYDPSGEDGSF